MGAVVLPPSLREKASQFYSTVFPFPLSKPDKTDTDTADRSAINKCRRSFPRSFSFHL